MERLLFSRVPAWVLIAFAILSVIGMIGVAVLVYDHFMGPKRFGALSRAAGFVGGLPEETLRSLRRGDPMRVSGPDRFEGRAGWTLAEGATLPGYLLLSRHDGERGGHVVELVDLSTFEPLHSWAPDAPALFEGVTMTDQPDVFSQWTPVLFRAIHPIATGDGGLLIKDHASPLFRIDACGREVWRQTDVAFHHSTNPAPEGGYWIAARRDPGELGIVASDRYLDDALARVTEDGEIVELVSLTQALIDAGEMAAFLGDLFGQETFDPMHLNDIEPVPGDGPFWRAGDVFLSMRHMSTVLLYRPATGEIVWMKRGPWLAQHDVDIVDDHTISVFSNNTYNAGRGARIAGQSEVLFYDFETDTVTSPFAEAARTSDLRTVSEGLSDLLPDGSIMVEEENHGRVLIFSADQQILAEYVNRAPNGQIYRLGWSRYVDQAAGDRLVETLRGTTCGG